MSARSLIILTHVMFIAVNRLVAHAEHLSAAVERGRHDVVVLHTLNLWSHMPSVLYVRACMASFGLFTR